MCGKQRAETNFFSGFLFFAGTPDFGSSPGHRILVSSPGHRIFGSSPGHPRFRCRVTVGMP
jgi:hypothetical protein